MKELITEYAYDFWKSISRVQLTGEINDTIIEDFSSNIPEKVRANFQQYTRNLIFKDGQKDLINESRFMLALVMGMPSNADSEEEFRQVILQQELISYFAHLEAVFQNFQRIIYLSKPEFLPEKKEILWKDIFELKSYDKILDFVINEKLYKSGYLKISDLIIKLNSLPFQLKISVKKQLLKDLEEFTLIRNMIIHNGTKVSKDYEAFTSGRYKLNDKFILNRDIVNQFFDLIRIVVVETYASILTEFFGITKEDAYNEMSYTKEKESKNYTQQSAKRQ